jgi:hypothetical protein
MSTTPRQPDGDGTQRTQAGSGQVSNRSRVLRSAGLVAGGAVAASLLVGGANALAAATGTSTGSSTGTPSYESPAPGHGRQGGPGGGGSTDTPVTGDELAKVTAAVKAKDSSVTVSSVRKDPDGSYDVLATKAGAQVMYEVSADLKTISQGGGRGGHGGGPGGGGSADTPVTGDEQTKVALAVKAKDSSVTVTSVRKDPDGSYDVFATKAGAQVIYDVSADLKTITEHAQGAGANGGGPSASTSSTA